MEQEPLGYWETIGRNNKNTRMVLSESSKKHEKTMSIDQDIHRTLPTLPVSEEGWRQNHGNHPNQLPRTANAGRCNLLSRPHIGGLALGPPDPYCATEMARVKGKGP